MCLAPSGMLQGARGSSLVKAFVSMGYGVAGWVYESLLSDSRVNQGRIGIIQDNHKGHEGSTKPRPAGNADCGRSQKSYHSAAVLSHQFCLRQNVSFHGGF